ncbi:MAG: hypothetical protein CM1200mP41_07310 [Gammaproteobacteria bacterium]|nr:MAG: hypothetical protein CM1200mP41_07310 [Gammaproteobacteria bacterium]
MNARCCGRASAFHLPSSGPRSGTNQGPGEMWCNLHCLRNSHVTVWRTALLAPCRKSLAAGPIQAGAHCLEQPHGDSACSGWSTRCPARQSCILGSGWSDPRHTMAVGMGADVWVLDRNSDALENHWRQFGRSTNTIFPLKTQSNNMYQADLVIGGVLIPGSSAPKLVSRTRAKP